MRRLVSRLICALMFALLVAAGAGASWAQPVEAEGQAAEPASGVNAPIDQDSATKSLFEQIDVWSVQAKALEATLADERARDVELRELPGILEDLRQELRAFGDDLAPKLDDARARLDQLGPPPKESETPDAPEIAAQREELGKVVATFDSLIKQTDVLLVKAGQLIDTANQTRRERFTRTLLEPVTNFYSADLWRRAASSIPFQIRWFSSLLIDWISDTVREGPGRLLVIAFAALIAGGLTRLGLSGVRISSTGQGSAASRRERAGAAATIGGIIVSAPILAAMIAIYIAALAVGLATKSFDNPLFYGLLTIGSACLLISIIYRGFWPSKANLKLIETDQESANRMGWILISLIAIWAFDRLLTLADPILLAPYPLIVLRSLLVAAAITILIVTLLTVRIGKTATGRKDSYRGWAPWLVGLLGMAAAGIAFASLLGYVALARFAATQFVITGGVLLLMYLLHMTGEHMLIPHERRAASAAATDEGEGPSPIGTLRVIFSFLFDIVNLLVGGTVLLLLWRFDWVEVQGWITTAFTGVQIGGFTISLQAILIAIGVFALGLLLTRTVQRWVVARAAISGNIESGVRESIVTGIGYLGFALATIAAISYLGIGFSNLAIVAGALSVGIGFGLQSIFNNFASGLILLVERPIKVGDWITVGENEGFVKKISVRSTEIETVHRQSVIIPNADLITNTVTNWMHTDKIGRLDVPIGVSYSTDVKKFRAVMLKIADAHPAVLKSPQPVVHFAGYGDSSLDFELRVFLRDIGRRIPISSELRYSIWFALQDAGIQIPFPQRDLHIKDIADTPNITGSRKRRREPSPKPAREAKS